MGKSRSAIERISITNPATLGEFGLHRFQVKRRAQICLRAVHAGHCDRDHQMKQFAAGNPRDASLRDSAFPAIRVSGLLASESSINSASE
jgi:hypothetical protein